MAPIASFLALLLAISPTANANEQPVDADSASEKAHHSVVRHVAERATDSETPLLMNTGIDAKTTCGDTTDGTPKMVCYSWLNGASAGNGWTQSRSPQLFPDYCPSEISFDLAKQRKIFLDYLDDAPAKKLQEPAILLFREAMAGTYPCADE